MTLAELLVTDTEHIYNTDEHAVAATYYTVDGAAIDLAVLVDIGDEMSAGAVGSNPASVATIRVRSDLVADPQPDDVVTIAGVSWRVLRIVRSETGTWVLEGVKDERLGAR